MNRDQIVERAQDRMATALIGEWAGLMGLFAEYGNFRTMLAQHVRDALDAYDRVYHVTELVVALQKIAAREASDPAWVAQNALGLLPGNAKENEAEKGASA